MAKELSIFIDESGDFGDYESYCPFYLVTFVFHDQKDDITNSIKTLSSAISYLNIPDNYVHAGPIIRQEGDYYFLDIEKRRKAINIAINFIRTSPILYHTFLVDRKIANDEFKINAELSKQIKDFIDSKFERFLKYTSVKVYYDNGQKQLTRILASVLPITISREVSFKKIDPPSSYKLFQVADIITTFELTNEKISRGAMSKYEQIFFKTIPQFKRDYYDKISTKKI